MRWCLTKIAISFVALALFIAWLEVDLIAPNIERASSRPEASNNLPTFQNYYRIAGHHLLWVDPSNEMVGTVDLTNEYATNARAFVPLNPRQLWRDSHTGIYGTDGKGVYFQYQLIPGADPQTFIILNAENALSKDKQHVYIRAEPQPDLDPNSIEFLRADKDRFYLTSNGKSFMFNNALDSLIELSGP